MRENEIAREEKRREERGERREERGERREEKTKNKTRWVATVGYPKEKRV